MARPLRLQVAGGIYHVAARGNAGQTIFRDGDDRQSFLSLLPKICRDFEWGCWAYCLMGTHYHLLLHTAQANLSAGMRDLNRAFACRWHQRHGTYGHLFQGRFFSSLVERDAHSLAVARYIAMNPVEAGLCKAPEDWAWSSYADMCVGRRTSACDPGPLLEQLDADPLVAGEAFRRFVIDGRTEYDADDIGRYGHPGFGAEHLPGVPPPAAIPRRFLTGPRKTLDEILGPAPDVHRIVEAHVAHGYSLSELARTLGRHRTTIARYVRMAAECDSPGPDPVVARPAQNRPS